MLRLTPYHPTRTYYSLHQNNTGRGIIQKQRKQITRVDFSEPQLRKAVTKELDDDGVYKGKVQTHNLTHNQLGENLEYDTPWCPHYYARHDSSSVMLNLGSTFGVILVALAVMLFLSSFDRELEVVWFLLVC